MLLWVGEGRFREKFAEIRGNEVALAVLAYVGLHLLGLLWSTDLREGFAVMRSQWKLLLLPVVMTIVVRKDRHSYIHSFIAAMTISMIVSYLIWFGLLSERHATHVDPTPFIDHISYNPFLAWAIYLTLQEAFFRPLSRTRKYGFLALALAMTINLLITQGRSGQVAFLALLILFIIQYWRYKIMSATLVSMLVLTTVLGGAYLTIPNFKQRIATTIDEVFLYRQKGPGGADTSVGLRITFILNSIRMIKSNPLLGVGTGDFAEEYEVINRRYSPECPTTKNPHNQYLMATTHFGICGLLLLLFIFYRQFQSARLEPEESPQLRLALSIFYLILCFGESYLQIHTTTLLYSIFGGIIFKKGDECCLNLSRDHR